MFIYKIMPIQMYLINKMFVHIKYDTWVLASLWPAGSEWIVSQRRFLRNIKAIREHEHSFHLQGVTPRPQICSHQVALDLNLLISLSILMESHHLTDPLDVQIAQGFYILGFYKRTISVRSDCEAHTRGWNHSPSDICTNCCLPIRGQGGGNATNCPKLKIN